jgi:hypothetical protein
VSQSNGKNEEKYIMMHDSCMSLACSEMDITGGNEHVAFFFDGLFAVFTYLSASHNFFFVYVTEPSQYSRSNEIYNYRVRQSEIFT